MAPSFDELDAVAVDGKGDPKRLSGKQLEYIRERGWVAFLVQFWYGTACVIPSLVDFNLDLLYRIARIPRNN